MRKIKKTLIYILVIITIGNVLLTSISISKKVSVLSQNIKTTYKTVATIQNDNLIRTHYSQSRGKEFLEEYNSVINEMQNSKYVLFSSIRYYLQIVQLQNVYGTNPYNGIECYDNCRFNPDFGPIQVDIIGTDSSRIVDEILGYIRVDKGRTFTDDEIENGYVTIIPNNYVNEKGETLKVGDKITLSKNVNKSNSNSYYEPLSIELEVIGTYEIKKDDQFSSMQYQIIVPNFVIVDYIKKEIENINAVFKNKEANQNRTYLLECFAILQPYYEINSYDEADSFEMETNQLLKQSLYIKDHYKIVATNDTLERILVPLQSVEKIATIIKYSAYIFFGLILFLILNMFIKSSTQEIAVYYTLGQSKSNIIIKFCREILIMVCISFSGIYLTAPMLNDVIVNQITKYVSIVETEQTDTDANEHNQVILEMNEIEEKNWSEELKIGINNEEYLICAGYILIISIIGCILMVFKILKTNIKDILM